LSQSTFLFENIAEIPPQISSILLQNIAFDKPLPQHISCQAANMFEKFKALLHVTLLL